MGRASRQHRAKSKNVVDLYDYAPARRRPTPPKWNPVVTDDWPERVPITEAEIEIIEVHFADLLDELFGPRG
jgi:hypothetical protein